MITQKPTNYKLPNGTNFIAGGQKWQVKMLTQKSYNENENRYEAESNGRSAEFSQKVIMQKLT